MSIRVFLLDDHEVVRRGLRELLESEDDIDVVGEAATAEEAYGRIPPTTPNVAVLDVRLPDGSGIEVCREIRSRHPEIAWIMLTSYADDEAVYAAIMAGAAGYVLKQVRGTELVDGIRRVAAGDSLLDPSVTTRVLDRLRHKDDVSELAALTEQERKILELIAEGLTNRQIGERMFLAEKTVKNYVSNMFAKLGMSRRTEAAAYAARLAERRAHESHSDDAPDPRRHLVVSTSLLLVALAVWLAIGLGLSVVLGRRGHDPFSWFVLGTLLGPLAIAFVFYAWRHEEPGEPEVIAASPLERREGAIDVLLGFDDSAESRAAVASVIRLFGARLGRLTLMTVIPFDGGAVVEEQARALLQREAERLAWLAPGLEVVRGDPATALAAAAVAGRFDLLAVGTTGQGRARLFGSAARQLAGQSRVPVLLTGTEDGKEDGKEDGREDGKKDGAA